MKWGMRLPSDWTLRSVSGALPRILVGALLLIYPLLVLFGMNSLGPRILSLSLFVMLLVRYHFRDSLEVNMVPLVVVPAILLLFGMMGYEDSLLYIPFAINACLLFTFGQSIFRPPSIVEQFARKLEPNLPPEAVPYCLNVTKIWCAFFAINGLIALGTSIFCSREIWAFYNSGISNVLIAVLFGSEYLYRQRFRRKIFAEQGRRAGKIG